MRPHAQDADNALLQKDFVHQTVMDVDAARVRPGQITDKFLERWRSLEGILRKDFQQRFGVGLQPRGCEFLCVLARLRGIHDGPTHQSSSRALFDSGSFRAAMIDSRMPGMERK